MSITLLPIENVSLTVALSQALRGAPITPNVAQMCVLALARITERHDWTVDESMLEIADLHHRPAEF